MWGSNPKFCYTFSLLEFIYKMVHHNHMYRYNIAYQMNLIFTVKFALFLGADNSMVNCGFLSIDQGPDFYKSWIYMKFRFFWCITCLYWRLLKFVKISLGIWNISNNSGKLVIWPQFKTSSVTTTHLPSAQDPANTQRRCLPLSQTPLSRQTCLHWIWPPEAEEIHHIVFNQSIVK